MIVRTAMFVGNVDPHRQEAFDRTVQVEALPLLQALPGVIEANVLRTLDQEEGLPAIYQIYQLRFQDRAAMEAMFESAERLAVHDIMSRILPWFEGTIVHLVSEVS
jgi:antibiotic biosynthesis monooxygenase (ABM) superfamily enzyme